MTRSNHAKQCRAQTEAGVRRRSAPAHRSRPQAEVLEDRRVLTPFLWTGAVNHDWTNPGNWVALEPANNTSKYPSTSSDFAIVNKLSHVAKVVRSDVNLDANISVGTIELDSGGINLYKGQTPRTLTVTTSYRQDGGTVSGPGTLFLGAAGAVGGATALIAAPSQITGALVDVRPKSTLLIQDTTLGDTTITFTRTKLKVEAGGIAEISDTVSLQGTTLILNDSEVVDQGTFKAYRQININNGPTGTAPSAFVVAAGAAFETLGQGEIDHGTQMRVWFDNSGTVARNGASLILSGGGIAGGKFLEQGRRTLVWFTQPFQEPPETYLWQNGTVFDGTGAGGGGVASGVSVNADIILAGTVKVDASSFDFGGGSIVGSAQGEANLVIEQGTTFAWRGGTVGRASVRIAAPAGNQPGGTLDINAGTLENNGAIINNDTVTMTFRDFAVNTGARILNDANATFEIQSDVSIEGDGTGTFLNAAKATLTKSARDGESKIDGVAVTNMGQVEVKAGTLTIPQFVQEGGKADENGGIFETTLQLKGGELENIGPSAVFGEVSGDVMNTGGIVEPGGPGLTGVLKIDGTNGNYTQSGHGVLEIDLDNPAPGDSDQLIVRGNISLGGALKVETSPGFKGDSFTIISNEGPGPVVGTFDGLPEGTSINVGGRNFAITYRGGPYEKDVVLNALEPTATTVVASANPSVYGQPDSFTATVAPAVPNGAVPTGSVQFQVDGVKLGGPVVLSAGSALSPSVDTLAPGSHTVTALYSGNNLFLASNGTTTETVDEDASTVTVVSSDLSAVYGEPLTFAATVTPVSPGAGAPTGTVEFHALFPGNKTVLLGTGELRSGNAAFTMPYGLATGPHTIFAVYVGDADFMSSTSPTIAQAVNPAPTTLQLVPSATVVNPGQGINYNEILSVGEPGSFVTPATGTITLYDTFDGATTVLSTNTLGGPTVNFPPLAGVGTHSITAMYSGDGNFQGCTSATITITVAPPT
jgi:hypothetical protein